MQPSLNRRHFLGLIGAGALTACEARRGASTSTTAAAATSTATTTTTSSNRARRMLVVVQLGGGNDALNTVVPLDGRYHDARPEIGLADDQLVKIPGVTRYGLHPSLAPMANLLSRTAIVNSVGFPAPDRSHFVAMDTWLSATPGRAATTGWLGRYLDATGGTTDNPLRAVALGSGTLSLLGGSSRPTVVLSPDAFAVRRGADRAAFMAAWQTVGGQPAAEAIAALNVFDELKVSAAAAPTTDDGDGGEITDGLITAADLLVSGHGSEVINVAVGGFDTHSAENSQHERLLGDLAKGLVAFFKRIDDAGLTDQVMVLTMSEFGRRVAENGSRGTDHGKAGVQFLLGGGVRAGIVGDIRLDQLDDGDLKAEIDPRSGYATALDWLGGAAGSPADAVLAGRFPRLFG